MDDWERKYGWVRQAAQDAEKGRADEALMAVTMLTLCGVIAIILLWIL